MGIAIIRIRTVMRNVFALMTLTRALLQMKLYQHSNVSTTQNVYVFPNTD